MEWNRIVIADSDLVLCPPLQALYRLSIWIFLSRERMNFQEFYDACVPFLETCIPKTSQPEGVTPGLLAVESLNPTVTPKSSPSILQLY